MQPLWEKIGKENEGLRLVCQKVVAITVEKAYFSEKTRLYAKKEQANAESAKILIFRSEKMRPLGQRIEYALRIAENINNGPAETEN